MKIQIVVFNGFDELDAIAPFEVLQNAAELGTDWVVELVTLDGTGEVVASHGLSIRPQGKLDLTQPPDILIVPGGGWNNRAPQGAWAEAQKKELPQAIAQLHAAGTIVAGVCTGGTTGHYSPRRNCRIGAIGSKIYSGTCGG
jgi:putative intracellular protease/amidase